MKTTLGLMIQAERREGEYVADELAGLCYGRDTVAEQVMDNMEMEVACYGEVDPVMQGHYLVGRNYDPYPTEEEHLCTENVRPCVRRLRSDDNWCEHYEEKYGAECDMPWDSSLMDPEANR